MKVIVGLLLLFPSWKKEGIYIEFRKKKKTDNFAKYEMLWAFILIIQFGFTFY